MNRVGALLGVTAAALLCGAEALSSCARQGEGERCDINKGANGTTDSDCADGLNCTDPSVLQHHPNSSVCCPADGSFNTIACTPRQGTAGAGGAGSTASSAATGGGMGGSASSGSASSSSASSSKGAAATATSTSTASASTTTATTSIAATTGSGGAGGAGGAKM